MMKIDKLLAQLGVETEDGLDVFTPIDGSKIGAVKTITESVEIKNVVTNSVNAFEKWRKVPAPIRGEFIRLVGEELRANKENLGRLVTIESGKIYIEGLGEVQGMIDICDFAVGLSRQLYGLTMGSERLGHKLTETWHPLGPILVISAFNFPVAVWSWNYALATICGDSVIWKPSEKTPLTALACDALVKRAALKFNALHPKTPYPSFAHQVVVTDDNGLAQKFVEDNRVRLVSATGSTAMGKVVAPIVAARLGRSLLELGGNNAMIVMPSADLGMTLKAIVFSAVGTTGQRCTTLRRLFVHEDVYDDLVPRMKKFYGRIAVGDPLKEKILVGPLIDKDSYKNMVESLSKANIIGGIISGGYRILEDEYPDAYYVSPAVVEFDKQHEIMREETFAPILYVVKIDSLDEGIKLNNDVTQGLSSCIFSNDIRETELFLTETDTGLANVNIGPSGAEVGGAFGGEKDTGGGRESGSDAWKSYMRRATNTTNFSTKLPLAHGVKFDVD